MSELDNAIAATGPRIPFHPTLTGDDVALSLAKQDALIADMVTAKERAVQVVKGIAAVAPIAGIAFPAAAPFIPAFVGATDILTRIIQRGTVSPEDITDAAQIYADLKAQQDAAKAQETPDANPDAQTPSADATLTTINSDAKHTPVGHHDTSGDHKPAHTPSHTPEGHHDTSHD